MTLSTIIGVSVILLTIISLILFHKFSRRIELISPQTKVEPYNIKPSALFDVQINRELFEIKKSINADKVCLARFHNGGNYANGMHMKKFSVTHETPHSEIEPLMDKCNNVLNSRYPEAFLELVTLHDYTVWNINDCTDPNFKHDMKKYKFETTVLYLIKQYDGSDEGFIGINFLRSKVLTSEERAKVMEHIPTILGLVNMTQTNS